MIGPRNCIGVRRGSPRTSLELVLTAVSPQLDRIYFCVGVDFGSSANLLADLPNVISVDARSCVDDLSVSDKVLGLQSIAGSTTVLLSDCFFYPSDCVDRNLDMAHKEISLDSELANCSPHSGVPSTPRQSIVDYGKGPRYLQFLEQASA